MGYIGIVLAVIIALILVAFIFFPDFRKTVFSSFKEGQKTGEDWAKNSAVGDIAHSLGEKVGEAQKKLKK
jgi:hypothetical protein